jgi:hypothetical protein
MNNAVLRAESLRKSFGDKEVLRGVDLAIEPGAVLGVLGANGSGKTTLIKCALGLLRSSGGQVSVFGENSWDLSASAKARLGYVPQEVTSYPWMRVRQVIAYTAAFYPRWNQAFVDKLCDQWHVPREDRVGALYRPTTDSGNCIGPSFCRCHPAGSGLAIAGQAAGSALANLDGAVSTDNGLGRISRKIGDAPFVIIAIAFGGAGAWAIYLARAWLNLEFV